MYRHDDKQKENTTTRSRLQKLDKKIVMSFRDLMDARGGTEEEIALLEDQQPSIFRVQLDTVTRRHIRQRAKKTSSKKSG